jgi:hypothetical protein
MVSPASIPCHAEGVPPTRHWRGDDGRSDPGCVWRRWKLPRRGNRSTSAWDSSRWRSTTYSPLTCGLVRQSSSRSSWADAGRHDVNARRVRLWCQRARA